MLGQMMDPPPHIPQHLVFDFDFFKPEGSDDIHLAWKRLHEVAPSIFWTPRNGGHWVATRAADIEIMQTDFSRFSNKQMTLPILPTPYPLLPVALDPPDHSAFRLLIAPAFAPAATRKLTEKARDIAIELTEQIAPRGYCEFVGEFAKILPIVVFLSIFDLPPEDRSVLVPLGEDIVRSFDAAKKVAAYGAVAKYLTQWIERRTREPGTDLMSRIVHGSVNGRPLTDAEKLGLCALVLSAGLDTVAGMLTYSIGYLAGRPDLRRELIEHPELIPVAGEELMRRHGLSNTARQVLHDIEYHGILFKQGDMIQLPRALYSLDERLIPDPMSVDFHRPQPVPNATFGAGIHKCVGAMLARGEMRVFLEEWLKRIPDFQIKPETKLKGSSGMVIGAISLELIWNS